MDIPSQSHAPGQSGVHHFEENLETRKEINNSGFSMVMRPTKRNCLFPVTVRKKIGRRSVKKTIWTISFDQKCVFYACFTLIGSWEAEKTLG